MARKRTSKTKTVNLALQGGGAHGAFTWGVLDYLLEDARIEIEGISGTSAGAINAVVLADGFCRNREEGAREALENFWRRLSSFDLFSPIQRLPYSKLVSDWTLDNSPGRMFFDAMVRMYSPYEFNPLDINPLRELLTDMVDFELIRKSSRFKLFVSATNVRTGKIKVFDEDHVTVDAVLASSCLPHIFQAVEIDGEAYWDGGYMGNPPLYPLFYETDCQDVILVQVNPVEADDVPKSARAIENRLNEITFNSTLLRELRNVEFVTRLIDEGKLDPKEYMRVYMHVISAADEMKELSSSSKHNLELDFLIYLRDLGRKSAAGWLEQNFDRIGQGSSISMRDMID